MKSTRRGSFSVHRSEKTPGFKYSWTSGLSPRGHLERQTYFHGDVTRMEPVRLELLRHRLCRQIRDMTYHASQRQAHIRSSLFFVILSGVKMRVAQYRVA